MTAHIKDEVAQAGQSRESPASWEQRLVDLLTSTSRYIALLAAWIAMCGSLFMSEVLGWPPCDLCWYQRILMYPLALILAIGIFRRDRALHLYVLPFSLIGAVVALYHHLLIKTNWFPPPPCKLGVLCTVDYLDLFGIITIPFLALTAFVIIALMMTIWGLLGFVDDEVHEIKRTGLDREHLAAMIIIVSVVLSFISAGIGV